MPDYHGGIIRGLSSVRKGRKRDEREREEKEGGGNPLWLPVTRSGTPAARSTAKSTANAIEYSLAVRERKGEPREHVVLEPVGTPATSGRPNVGSLCAHVVENGRNSSRKNEYALYTANTNFSLSPSLYVSRRGLRYPPRMFALRTPNISRPKLYTAILYPGNIVLHV